MERFGRLRVDGVMKVFELWRREMWKQGESEFAELGIARMVVWF